MLMKLFDRTGDCKSAHAGAAHVGAVVELKKASLIFSYPKTWFRFQNGFQNELSFSKCGST